MFHKGSNVLRGRVATGRVRPALWAVALTLTALASTAASCCDVPPTPTPLGNTNGVVIENGVPVVDAQVRLYADQNGDGNVNMSNEATGNMFLTSSTGEYALWFRRAYSPPAVEEHYALKAVKGAKSGTFLFTCPHEASNPCDQCVVSPPPIIIH
jgi:hypothetical protein